MKVTYDHRRNQNPQWQVAYTQFVQNTRNKPLGRPRQNSGNVMETEPHTHLLWLHPGNKLIPTLHT